VEEKAREESLRKAKGANERNELEEREKIRHKSELIRMCFNLNPTLVFLS